MAVAACVGLDLGVIVFGWRFSWATVTERKALRRDVGRDILRALRLYPSACGGSYMPPCSTALVPSTILSFVYVAETLLVLALSGRGCCPHAASSHSDAADQGRRAFILVGVAA